MEIWLELCFDGQPVDNIVARSEEEAEDIIRNHSRDFRDQNEDIKEWWISEGFRKDPVVTIERSKK